MAKFLTGNELNAEIEKLFENAEEQIILISPYIKLHDRYASTLRTKMDNPKIKITIVFGKNEEDISKSMKQDDFNFFKEFPNIEIRYEKNLHAKYYSNESTAILTSMNLYSYSQDNNIEAGVLTKSNILGNLLQGEDLDAKAWDYFGRVISQSNLLFQKNPEYESMMLGLSKKYKTSKIEVDKMTDFFNNKPKYESGARKEIYEKKKIEFSLEGVNSKPEEDLGIDNLSDSKLFLTTALSKETGISTKDLFAKFEKLNFVERKNDEWVLTSLGKTKGAQMKKGQYGDYIAWPKAITNNLK